MRLWVVLGKLGGGWWLLLSLDVAAVPGKAAYFGATIGLYGAGARYGYPILRNAWLIESVCICGNC